MMDGSSPDSLLFGMLSQPSCVALVVVVKKRKKAEAQALASISVGSHHDLQSEAWGDP